MNRSALVRAVLSGGAVCVLIAGVAFALVGTLPDPGGGAETGARVLGVLERLHGTGSVIHLGGKRLFARCHRLYGYLQLVAYSDGSRTILRSAAVVSDGRRLASDGLAAERQVALADLGGDFQLYTQALLVRLNQRGLVVDGSTRVRNQPALRIRLGHDRPRLELLVAIRNLRPLAASYRSKRLRGDAILLAPTRRRSGC
jgi:hypothetical protein